MKNTPASTALCAMVVFALVGLGDRALGARIKDIADFEGVRGNKLVGYGLVVGLDGTGDGKSTKFTYQSMASMLEKMGIRVNPDDIRIKNVAAVMVTTELPPFAKAGSRIDILVSSIGDAENLQGGTLLLTPLKAADSRVYAVAQGPVSTGGFSAGGAGGKVQKNFPTVGRVIAGATIERAIPSRFAQKDHLRLTLRHSDFTTAFRVSQAINAAFSEPYAQTSDPRTISITIPDTYKNQVIEFVTLLEGLNVTPDSSSKIVINERTGTVVMGENVRIATIAIAHGNLSIQIKETPRVSQPLPFSEGETVVTPESDIAITEEKAPIVLVKSGVSIGEVVRALNALGVSPRDLIAILQVIKAAGALQAELEII